MESVSVCMCVQIPIPSLSGTLPWASAVCIEIFLWDRCSLDRVAGMVPEVEERAFRFALCLLISSTKGAAQAC